MLASWRRRSFTRISCTSFVYFFGNPGATRTVVPPATGRGELWSRIRRGEGRSDGTDHVRGRAALRVCPSTSTQPSGTCRSGMCVVNSGGSPPAYSTAFPCLRRSAWFARTLVGSGELIAMKEEHAATVRSIGCDALESTGPSRSAWLSPTGAVSRQVSLPRPAKPRSSHARARPATPRQAAVSSTAGRRPQAASGSSVNSSTLNLP